MHTIGVGQFSVARNSSDEAMAVPGSSTNQPCDRQVPWTDLTELAKKSAAEVTSTSTCASYATVIDQICRSLHRDMPRHVAIIHDPGIGEQILLFELARIGVFEAHPFLCSKRIVAVNCRHFGEIEIDDLLGAIVRQLGEATDTILFIENFASLFKNCGASEFRKMLNRLLRRIRSRVVCMMAAREFEDFVCSDQALGDLFSVVQLHEPDADAAVAMVRHFAVGMELQYHLRIEDDAVQRAVDLSKVYIPHERLPLKAVKILRSVCDDIEYARLSGAGCDRICARDVVGKVSEMSGIHETTLLGVGKGIDYRKGFGEFVVGQPHAIEEVATELGLINAGLVDSGKPASVMMFIGQTGTGKTELAKVLARFYSSSRRLKTFTLGNFSEPHSVSGIIGVPPGYVGHEQGGRLVNELNADPYGVFLLDEADKAHPDVMQPFLNLFDEGWICDQRGVKAYADRAIFILTTNVGQRQIADMCKNGKSIDEITSTMKESLARIRHTKSNRPVFSPEFMARIKRTVVFRSLDGEAMTGICHRLVGDIQEAWRLKRQRTISIPSELVGAIGRKAFAIDSKSQGKEGGRVVRKLLADIVESPILSAIGADPEGYGSCCGVSLHYAVPDGAKSGDLDADAVTVRFVKKGVPQ